MKKDIVAHLQFLYGEERADALYDRLQELFAVYQKALPAASGYFSERDAILITYGDMVRAPGERPLKTLEEFLVAKIAGTINTIHILPFFPYSSDDGFSVIDYKQVDPTLGDWPDVAAVNHSFRLMFDAVVNHISAESRWFQGFLNGEDRYQDYFIVVPPGTDLTQVFRPRSLPLLTEVETSEGQKLVWTTFSADQVDLNFANPEVLLEVIDTLLFYVAQGAALIRLDAIAYIWKELGTSCIHLAQTHRIIQLMRSILDAAAPHVALITETNVPHEDNISYFGDGSNEAQMVYNFSLPPLMLHAIQSGDATVLTKWAKTLELPSKQVTFFNFLASHDGIGLTPARGLLAEDVVQEIADRVQALGGYVSYRSNPDGSESPYELNISYIDALGEPGVEESDEIVARRFLAAQAIMLALRGVPGIYFHSLFGSRSWSEGVRWTGQKRTINREKVERDALESALDDPGSLRSRVFYPYTEMLRARADEPAFHPTGEQEVIEVHPSLFGLWRGSTDGKRWVLCLHNVADEAALAEIDVSRFGRDGRQFVDLLSGQAFAVEDGRLALRIASYGVRWLRPQ